MTEAERTFAVQHLEQSRKRALDLISTVTSEQTRFRRSENDWTAAEIVEHVILVEQLALRVLERMLKDGVRDESRRGKGAHKDRIILEHLPTRDIRVLAPPDYVPTGRWLEFEDLIEEFIVTRDRAIEFARTSDADLRVYFTAHPFLKDLDGYQWLILIGSHSERHMRQLEELLADARCPKAGHSAVSSS